MERFQPAKFTLVATRPDALPAGRRPHRGGLRRLPPESGRNSTTRRPTVHRSHLHGLPRRSASAPGTRHRRPAGDPRGEQACEVCHNARTWRQVADLRSFEDPLRSHRRLTAARRARSAIAPRRYRVGARKVVFQDAPLACVGCHEDVHAGQFAAHVRKARAAKPVTTTSNGSRASSITSRTSFSLTGAHERVPCKDCHSTRKEVNGRMVVFYKPTPKDCASCHGPKLKN